MNRLRAWRLHNRITQDAAARQIGISTSMLRWLESGAIRASPRVATLLERCFGESADALLSEQLIHDLPVQSK